MKSKNWQFTVLAILAFAALSGCGAKNTTSGSSVQASEGDRGDTSSGKPAARCNKYSDADVEVHLMAYTDGNGVRNNSLIRLKFVHVPSAYAENNLDIHIRKWTASETGIESPAPGRPPLFVDTRVELKSNGVYQPVTGWGYNLSCAECPTLEWGNMQLIAAHDGVSFASADTFFERYHLLLDMNDAAGDWKALKIIFMNGNTAVKTINILVPTFEANPADYLANTAKHPPILSNLHPFISMLNQHWPSSQFQTESNEFCF